MRIPVLVPLWLSGPAGATPATSGSIALAAVALHTGVMRATIALVSLVVCHWAGLAFLRSAWINLDLIWVLACGVCGGLLLVT